jgi:opacity protein-like surface antigen
MRLFLALLLILSATPAVLAADAVANPEIDYLLRFIESSECRFIRAGTEYPANEAAAHLRMKLGKAGDRVKTADAFITEIATKSYLTGKPYLIKEPDGTIQRAGPWLTQLLARHRKTVAPQ